MAMTSRARSIWNEIRLLVVANVLTLIDRRAEVIQALLDQKSDVGHRHPVSDVNGLPAALTAANTRVTALEADVAVLKQRAGL